MLRKVTHCTGRVSANTRPHQLRAWVTGRWGLAERYAAETLILTTVRRETFLGENFHKLVNFRGLLASAAKNATPTNFVKKTFANIYKLGTL